MNLNDEKNIYNKAIEQYYNNEIDYETIDKLKNFQSEIKSDAFLLVSLCYLYGYGVYTDWNEYQFWLNKAAELDNPKALLYLGQDQCIDYSDDESMKNGFNNFMKALNLGNTKAYKELALFYLLGIVIPTNINKAIEYIQKAIDNQDYEAYIYLGKWYENGIGFEQDLNKAYLNYEKAYNLGDSLGKFHIGRCYCEGIGVNKDIIEGIKLISEAKVDGVGSAKSYLNDLILTFDQSLDYEILFTNIYNNEKNPSGESYYNFASTFLIKNYSSLNIDIDKKRGIQYLIKSAELYYPPAQYLLGVKYLIGDDINKDIELGISMILKAADANIAEAFGSIGQLYELGVGFEINHQKAFENYKKSYELGSLSYVYELARFYYEGNYCQKDDNMALELFKKSLSKGKNDALLYIAKLYLNSENIPHNYPEAVKILKQLSCENNIEARMLLGDCFYHGKGVTKNYNNAYECYTIGYKAGHPRGPKLMTIFNDNQCPHCKNFFTAENKKTLFGMKIICKKCGKAIEKRK